MTTFLKYLFFTLRFISNELLPCTFQTVFEISFFHPQIYIKCTASMYIPNLFWNIFFSPSDLCIPNRLLSCTFLIFKIDNLIRYYVKSLDNLIEKVSTLKTFCKRSPNLLLKEYFWKLCKITSIDIQFLENPRSWKAKEQVFPTKNNEWNTRIL